jgi:hypothetical protein
MTPTQGEPLSLLNVYQGMGELVLFCISLIMFFFLTLIFIYWKVNSMQAEISVSFVLYLSFLEQVKVWHLK